MLNSIMEPAVNWLNVTPHDTHYLAQINKKYPRALYVGVGGNVELIDEAGTTVVFNNVAAGIFDVQPVVVKATNTTATNIVALY